MRPTSRRCTSDLSTINPSTTNRTTSRSKLSSAPSSPRNRTLELKQTNRLAEQPAEPRAGTETNFPPPPH